MCGGERGDCTTVKLCLCVCDRVRCVVGWGGGGGWVDCTKYCKSVFVCDRVRCVVGRGVTVPL